MLPSRYNESTCRVEELGQFSRFSLSCSICRGHKQDELGLGAVFAILEMFLPNSSSGFRNNDYVMLNKKHLFYQLPRNFATLSAGISERSNILSKMIFLFHLAPCDLSFNFLFSELILAKCDSPNFLSDIY